MRKVLIFGVCTFLLLWISATMFSQEGGAGDTGTASQNPNNEGEVLIDFTAFEDRIDKSGLYEEDIARNKPIAELDNKDPKQIDPKTLAPAYRIQASDLKYARWMVQLNSSANTVENRRWSYSKKVQLKNGKSSVLGVRIHFPKHRYNAYAKIAPPYELRAYNNDGSIVSRNDNGKFIGVIDNVGDIKKLAIDVSGRNYKYGLSIRLRDNYDEVKEYFMGYLYYVNWRILTWENPNYLPHVDFRELYRIPLYPREVPYKKFDSIIVYRPGEVDGGDFIAYFKKINMWFDFAIPPETLKDIDIDDEAQWGIIAEIARKKRKIETIRARERIELMRQEKRKLGKNEEPKDPLAAKPEDKTADKQ